MTLQAGTRLGPYEVTSTLGAGGMGEVYRARDTRLDRDVALKILPENFADDPERVARFQREARTLAALNHPHIGGIYGLEDAPGMTALVLELVDGPTLGGRIAEGPIPLDEALPIARQIAEALQAAHEQGIIHRDLKPANIKIRADGDVKVLDFGLAKMLEPDGLGSSEPAATHSPTLSVAATHAGVILGTASYMAPEQAKGRIVDKRSDIWAFGCVLYEMLTGKRAFDGEDVTDIIGAVVRLEPDWTALPTECPAAVRALLKRCLEKDRRKRIADISTALFVLDEAAGLAGGPAKAGHYVREDAAQSVVPVVGAGFSRPDKRRLALVGAAALTVGAFAASGAVWFATRPAPPRVTRMTITPPKAAALNIDGNDRDLVITPDGTRVVHSGGVRGEQIFVRALDAVEPIALLVTPIANAVAVNGGGAQGLFTSPDGQWVGYVENNTTLKKVAITGGPSVTLQQLDGNSRGITWAADDTLVFATAQTATGLQRIPAAGGSATVLTRPDRARGEADHLWPEALPGGRSVLFTVTAVKGGLDAAQVAVLDLATGSYKTLVRGGSQAHYAASGHLVYAAASTLRAVAFDLDRLEARGTPVPVVPRLLTTAVGAADFSVAADGTLVYVDASPVNNVLAQTLVWVDRQGAETPLNAPARAYRSPRLSHDGTHVALELADQEQDIWTWDVARATLTRLTFEPGVDNSPIWTPDGRRLVFASDRAGVANLYIQAADGTGAAERLSEGSNGQFPTGVTPDGTRVVFHEVTPMMGQDLMLLTLGREGRVSPLLQTRFDERNGVISPDGRWLAYESNASGQYEIYVRPFPNVGDGQWQVSTGGGRQPLWARSGRELFYVAVDGALRAVRVEPGGTGWNAGSPANLLGGRLYTFYAFGIPIIQRMYDVSPDGQRFLMIREAGESRGTPPQIIVIQNWLEELKRLVPTN